MNKEKFKTLLLAFLIGLSILLGKNIRDFTLHNIVADYKTKDTQDDSYKLSDVIIPKNAFLSFSESEKTVIYADNKYELWKTAQETLEDIFKTRNIEKSIVSLETYRDTRHDRFINFKFSEDLHVNMIGKILDIEIPKDLYKNLITVENIKFTFGEESFLIFSNGSEKLILKINPSQMSKLSEIFSEIEQTNYTNFYKVSDITGAKSDLYIPVNSKTKIPTVNINTKYNIAKDINLEDTLAELFFYKKIEYIKKIEENTGASIYIDEENILKIYEDGRLEYSGNLEENSESDLYSSLRVAVDFVSKHRGWPENVFLSSIEPISISDDVNGHKLIFRYKINGLTVLSNKDDIQDKIEVEVLNGTVTSYKSRIWNYLGLFTRETDVNILSAFEIIDNNFMLLKDAFLMSGEAEGLEEDKVSDEVKKSIDDMYLAYYGYLNGKQEILNPVWVIEFLDEKYMFDAYSGKPKS